MGGIGGLTEGKQAKPNFLVAAFLVEEQTGSVTACVKWWRWQPAQVHHRPGLVPLGCVMQR